MKKLIVFVLTIIGIMVLSYDYETLYEATGVSLQEAKEKAIQGALAEIARMIAVRIEEEAVREIEVSAGEVVKDVYRKHLKVTTDIVLEGYKIDVLSEEKMEDGFKVKIRVSIPSDVVSKIMRCFSTLSLVKALMESGYLSKAQEILESRRDIFESLVGYARKYDELSLEISKNMDVLNEEYGCALNDLERGKIFSFLEKSADILKKWKDFPKKEMLRSKIEKISNEVELNVDYDSEFLLVAYPNGLKVSILMNGEVVSDNVRIHITTPDWEKDLTYDGATLTVVINPEYVRENFPVKMEIVSPIERTIRFPVRVLSEKNEINGCVLKTSKEKYSVLKVGESVDVILKAPQKIWYYIFDYVDSTKTAKLLLERRMTKKGYLKFSISFDEPTYENFEGLVVVFSKDRLTSFKTGRIYKLDVLRSVISQSKSITTKEWLFRIVKDENN